jgi:hypothetical protein
MSFLWKTLIILAIFMSLAYGVWDIYIATTFSTEELEKYAVDPIQPNLYIPVFDHLSDKESNIYTKSKDIGSNN